VRGFFLEDVPVELIVASIGFTLGIIFGATAQSTNFCTMGAISDIIFIGNWNRFRAWVLSISVALFLSQILHFNSVINLNNSIYLSPSFSWAGAIIGGLMFGFGMTLTGGCGNKILVRIGAGSLKSLIVFIFLGLFAYMTLRGLLGPVRQEFELLTIVDLKQSGLKSQSIPEFLGMILNITEKSLEMVIASIIASLLFIFCIISRSFRSSYKDLSSGLIIGILIALGWFTTGVLGNDEFEPIPLSSFTFVAPIGEAIQYLMTFTGSTIDFGVASVGGVLFGSFIMAKIRGEFRIESFTTQEDLINHIFGAALMGIGGVLALGCTIGQGISGLSTLAASSFIAFFSIIIGCRIALKYLEEESFIGLFKN
tara:strand:- start:4769 stop:5872 length:1104 start_codon:yes stop_codon:yes gene_type:complete